MGCCGNGPKIPKPNPAFPPLSIENAKMMARQKIGAELTSDERMSKRLQSCKQCPHLKDDLCFRCGCRMVTKLALLHTRCPVGKW